MSKKTYHLCLSILMPTYCLILILFAYIYTQNNSQTIRAAEELISEKSNLKSNHISDLNSATTTSDKVEEVIKQESEIFINNLKSENLNSDNSVYIKNFQYLKIINSCDLNFMQTSCVNVRSGPGTDFPGVIKLRNNIVVKTNSQTIGVDGKIWHRIIFDEWLRYPERVSGDWYISGDYVEIYNLNIEKIINKKEFKRKYNQKSDKKKILVDISEQKLYAYQEINGEIKLFLEAIISSGLDDTPTPVGNFEIFYKTPSRYMQGPVPPDLEQYYDLPGVSYVMYFSTNGLAVHGTYWHDKFGQKWSHGCVNLKTEDAEKLYEFSDLGTEVIVQE